MIPVGTLVRIRYPDYVAGMRGRIQGQESSGRYIVRLEENPLDEREGPLVLSLELADFEILHAE